MESDFGGWSGGEERVRFRSQEGHGSYFAAVRAQGGAPLLTLRSGAGVEYTFRRVRTVDQESGFLRVSVLDAEGKRVPGAMLHFRAPDGLVSRAGTTVYDAFTTAGPPGAWTVTLTPPAGYALAPSQANPATVAVAGGVLAELVFVLRPA